MLKVVVVEDEALVRRGIVLAVDWASLNCVVVGEAENGEQGLEVVRRYQPDLIITDIRMPKMDGLKMLRRLRNEGNDAYVLLLTAYSDFAYAQEAVKLGAADYLLKPFHDGDLESAIQNIQQRAQSHRNRLGSAPQSRSIQGNAGGKSKYVMGALDYITTHYQDPDLCVSSIARNLDISESHLSHVFKKETSFTLTSYVTNYRIHVALELLKDCRSKVYEVAEQIGYRDITYFSSTFKKVVGMSPSEYQRQAQ